jgi:hypothetical protein
VPPAVAAVVVVAGVADRAVVAEDRAADAVARVAAAVATAVRAVARAMERAVTVAAVKDVAKAEASLSRT